MPQSLPTRARRSPKWRSPPPTCSCSFFTSGTTARRRPCVEHGNSRRGERTREPVPWRRRRVLLRDAALTFERRVAGIHRADGGGRDTVRRGASRRADFLRRAQVRRDVLQLCRKTASPTCSPLPATDDADTDAADRFGNEAAPLDIDRLRGAVQAWLRRRRLRLDRRRDQLFKDEDTPPGSLGVPVTGFPCIDSWIPKPPQ